MQVYRGGSPAYALPSPQQPHFQAPFYFPPNGMHHMQRTTWHPVKGSPNPAFVRTFVPSCIGVEETSSSCGEFGTFAVPSLEAPLPAEIQSSSMWWYGRIINNATYSMYTRNTQCRLKHPSISLPLLLLLFISSPDLTSIALWFIYFPLLIASSIWYDDYLCTHWHSLPFPPTQTLPCPSPAMQ